MKEFCKEDILSKYFLNSYQLQTLKLFSMTMMTRHVLVGSRGG